MIIFIRLALKIQIRASSIVYYIEDSNVKTKKSSNTDSHVLFKSKNYLSLSEMCINVLYFFLLSMLTIFITKIKIGDYRLNRVVDFFSTSGTRSSHSTSSFVNSINKESSVDLNNEKSRNNLYKKFFAAIVFYVLVMFMIIFTYSTSAFSLKIKCEGFFKNNSKMVSKKNNNFDIF